MRAFHRRMLNRSLSCEPNNENQVSFTGFSRHREGVSGMVLSTNVLYLRVRIYSEFRWYRGQVIVRPKLKQLGAFFNVIRKL